MRSPARPTFAIWLRDASYQGRRHRQAHLLPGFGQCELRADRQTHRPIRAGTPEARAALHRVCRENLPPAAAIDLAYIMIDSDLLDVLLTWDQTGQYEVAELRG